MFQDDFWDDSAGSDDKEELLNAYENIKNGQPSTFFEEEDYEYIIEYFLCNNNESEALNACELSLEHYPYSSSLLLIKAEVLFHAQRYGQALHALDAADK